jgi:hypothetical protein
MADFNLGRIKFKWRGDWTVSTAYLIDDIVKYGGNTYVAIQNFTSTASIPQFYDGPYTNYWSLHTEGLFFKGNWASSTFYKLNDLVKNGAFQYRCKLQHTSGESFAIGSNWEIFTEGLQWEDSYNSGTTYEDGDVVTYGGYTYVYVNATPSSGNTPTDNSYWDVLTTGFKATGDYSAGTAYKTGDTINFGGWAYVCIINTTAGQNPYSDSNKWQVINEGFNYAGIYSASTTYFKGDVVVFTSSSYVAVENNILNVTPGTDVTKWGLLAQGDTASTLTTRGDISYRDSTQVSRLPIGITGSVLTSDGLEPIWQNPEGKNVLYVSNGGSDNNPGTLFLPFKTIRYALSQATSNDVVDIENISGGISAVNGIYTVTSTGGSGTGFTARVVIDGSSLPAITIIDGGEGYTQGDQLTISSSQIGGTPATNIQFDVKSVGVGDVIYIKNGVYKEILPLRVPSGVSVKGESLRGTEVQPVTTGIFTKSTTIATITNTSTISGATNGTYHFKHGTTTLGSGDGLIVNVTIAGNVVSAVEVYHGGFDYAVGNTISLTASEIECGGSGTLTITVATLEDNNASYMWLLNDTNNITLMTFKGMSGTTVHTGLGSVICSLDPSGSILTASPYIQDCTSVNANATGIKIDGNLHLSGNKSILANDFTQINSDGIGVWALGGGRGEMVSVFTYYCDKSFYATGGGFIRGLNCSSAYGEQGAVADGTLYTETPVGVQGNGEMLNYNPATFGGGATATDLTSAITTNGSGTATVLGLTSGATATYFRYNTSLNYLHIKNRSGNFQKSETIRITAENSSTFTVNLNDTFGHSDSTTVAQQGQLGPLISVKSGTTTLSSIGLIRIGTNIKFAGNATYYRVSAVSEENTAIGTATVRLTDSVTQFTGTIDDGEVGNITTKFSNVRLTGHDFLDIGTGGFADTNYPGIPNQPADQSDEVDEQNGGRVYFSSTDQDGDFRVGDLFRIQQSTGIATLNADAFDLSGLSQLQLGSIGAELGATINEFSTDETLGGDSNSSVPTERAVLGYLIRDNAGTGAWVPPTGTTAERPTGGNLYTGALRYNSSLVTWEGYNGSQWTGLGGGNPWQTFTADGSTSLNIAANDRYFINTSGGAATITLPSSPLTGDSISILDLASTFDTNNCTLDRNGNKIMGLTENLVLSVEDEAITLVYTGATFGWKLTTNL